MSALRVEVRSIQKQGKYCELQSNADKGVQNYEIMDVLNGWPVAPPLPDPKTVTDLSYEEGSNPLSVCINSCTAAGGRMGTFEN